jgi:diacylglycerol kinase (ATP)
VLREFDLPFTVIPTGTGNDFAREIGAMRRTLDETLAKISETPVAIDSVIIKSNRGEARACQVLSLGFDALVNERANGFRRIRGKMKYVVATIRELALFKPMRFEINIDGVDYSQHAMLIAVANGPSYGGGMKICPGARFDDGLLDVLILSKVSIIELIKVFPKVYSGSHISHRAVEVIKGREITVNAPVKAYADGEYISELPITIHVEPGSLKVWR